MNALMIHALPTLFGVLFKGTLLLLATALICRLLRRSSAATRHLVWTAALGAILVLPLLSASVPNWNVRWGRITTASSLAVPAPTVVDQPRLQDDLPQARSLSGSSPSVPAPNRLVLPAVADPRPFQAAPKPRQSRKSPSRATAIDLGLLVWLIGSLCVLSQLAVGLSRIKRLARQAVPLEAGVLRIADAARQQLGLRRHVQFLQKTEPSGVAVPVTWGVLQPIVLLPAQSSDWSDGCRRAALLHELAHVQRWDWLTQLGTCLACALYWWHPLVWWAARQAREESERACDDLVLNTGMKPADYAQRLVEVVRSMPAGAPARTVAVAMAQPSEVEGRLGAVLAKGKERGPVARRGVAAVLAVVALLLLPLASLRMAVQAQQADDGSILTGTVVPPGAVVTRNTRWALALISMRDVACPRFPNRPITVRAVPDASGKQHYLFHDGRTGRDYRDSGQIRDDFARLLAQGSQPRPGAAAYPVPPNLAAMTRTYGRHLFFTSIQRAKASRLDQEARGWAARDFALVLADGDMEPKASAAAGPNGATLTDSLLPEGAGKLAKFERAHVGEYLGIVVGDSTLPRAVALVGTSDARRIVVGGLADSEARALADDINVPSGTEVIGGGIQRATYPDGTIYEADEDEGQQASVVSGYSAVLPSGYTVEVTGVTRAKRKNDKWVEGGLRWTPSGRPLPAAAPTTSNGWSWPVGVTGGLAPHFADVRITPPHGQFVTEPFSTYLSLGGTATVAWARTFQRWGDRTEAFYPQNGRPCSLRVGVAAGPWRTVASLPVHLNSRDLVPPLGGGPWPLEIKLDDRPTLMYQDRQGHAHTEHFLPAGQRLGNVARRIVAVEVSGRTVAGSNWNSHPVATSHSVAVSDGRNSDVYPVATGIFDISFYGPLVSDVSKVREYRLETRPYQVVEFRNVQLQPRVTGGPSSQAPLLSSEQAEKGRRRWIAPPSVATVRPLTFENRVGGKLLSVLHAQNGYDPLTATLRQVTMTNYRNDGSVRSLIECKQAQWHGDILAMNKATVRSFDNNSAQTVTVHARIMALNPENSTLTVGSGGVATSVGAGQWKTREQKSLSNMRRISVTILEYVQDNGHRLPPMKTLPALEKALAPYLKQQEKFPDPTTGQPYRVRGIDLFISPLTGQPYVLTGALSGKPISQVSNPASTVLFSDTLMMPWGATRCVLEAFADGHVRGQFFDARVGGRAIQ